jgi:hypothetical protein
VAFFFMSSLWFFGPAVQAAGVSLPSDTAPAQTVWRTEIMQKVQPRVIKVKAGKTVRFKAAPNLKAAV